MTTKIGCLRLCNEEKTAVACALSVAPVLDYLFVTYSKVDQTDNSINYLKDWQDTFKKDYGMELVFNEYPYHVDASHSLEDLRTSPEENYLSTYNTFAVDAIRDFITESKLDDVLACKIDGDLVYIADVFGSHFDAIVEKGYLQGSYCAYNTLVYRNKFLIYHPVPLIGKLGRGGWIRRPITLPKFYQDRFYEGEGDFVVDTVEIDGEMCDRYCTQVPNLAQAEPSCFHFMSEFRSGGVVREFNESEICSLEGTDILDVYKAEILPILQKADSPFQDLTFDF